MQEKKIKRVKLNLKNSKKAITYSNRIKKVQKKWVNLLFKKFGLMTEAAKIAGMNRVHLYEFKNGRNEARATSILKWEQNVINHLQDDSFKNLYIKLLKKEFKREPTNG